jgi:hypothetical protein
MKIFEKIQSAVNYCNTITGKTDTDLTTAIKSLGEGYGVGDSEPIEYTNLLQSEDVTIYINKVISTSSAGNLNDSNGNFVIELPLQNWGNADARFRFRGMGLYNNYINYSIDGTTWTVAYWNSNKSAVIDEYGDRLFAPTAAATNIAYRFSLSAIPTTTGVFINSVDEVRNSGIIITANQPIGNTRIIG